MILREFNMRLTFICFYYYYYSRPAIEKLVSISQKKIVVVMGEIQVKTMLTTTTNGLTFTLAPPRFQKLI